MKKLLSLTAAAFATLAWVGCSQDGVINEAPSANRAIEFGTYLGRDAQAPTRASVRDEAHVKEHGFGVFAYYTKNVDFKDFTAATPDFMKNQKVTYDETTSKWTYTPIKYWPNNEGDKVSFFAYAPYDGSFATPTFEAGKVTINFTVADEVKDQKDFLWNKTEQVDVTKKMVDADGNHGAVKFTFAHALARIGFTLQCAVNQVAAGGTIADETTVTVEKIILSSEKHSYTSGNFTEPNAGAFFTGGTFDFNSTSATDAWSEENGAQTFTLDADDFNDVATDGDTPKIIFDKDDNNPKTNTDDSYLMVIPQDFSTTPFYVFIQYKVTTVDDKLTGQKSEITNYISKPIYIDLQAGNAYTYNLVLGLTDVQIDVDYTDWSTTETPVNLPENQETTGGSTGGSTGEGGTTDTPDPTPDTPITTEPDEPTPTPAA